MMYKSDQKFVLWGALSSHQQVLFRSPKIGNKDKLNIDIVFDDVGYMQIIPTLFGLQITLNKGASDINKIVQKYLQYPGRHLFNVISQDELYVVAAGHFIIYQNSFDFSDSGLHVSDNNAKGKILFDSRIYT